MNIRTKYGISQVKILITVMLNEIQKCKTATMYTKKTFHELIRIKKMIDSLSGFFLQNC